MCVPSRERSRDVVRRTRPLTYTIFSSNRFWLWSKTRTHGCMHDIEDIGSTNLCSHHSPRHVCCHHSTAPRGLPLYGLQSKNRVAHSATLLQSIDYINVQYLFQTVYVCVSSYVISLPYINDEIIRRWRNLSTDIVSLAHTTWQRFLLLRVVYSYKLIPAGGAALSAVELHSMLARS